MEKVWEIKDPDALFREMRTKRVREKGPPPEEKDPAKAYSLSLLCWGSGQLHNDQPVKGIAFLTLMFFFLAGSIASLIFHDRLLRYVLRSGISLADAFLAAEALLFCVILFWFYNASDAYQGTARSRRRPFKGVPSRALPFFCSLLLPGWGQFLNGQQLKGSIFSAFTVLSFFSVIEVPATLLAWPFLDAGGSRFYIDLILAVSLLFLPLVPLVWVLSCYDAYKVSSDDLLKESLWERIKAANNRRRTQGWVRGVFPRIKWTLALGLFLALVVTVIYYYAPLGYYAGWLAQARARMAEQGMTVVPDLIGRMLRLIERAAR